MGGSTPVPQNVRMKVWLETVPILLKTLNVEMVSLLSHSAGTLYALNTIYHLRDILDPKAPYVGLIGKSRSSPIETSARLTVIRKHPGFITITRKQLS